MDMLSVVNNGYMQAKRPTSGSFSTDMAIPYPACKWLGSLRMRLPSFGLMAIFVTNDPLVLTYDSRKSKADFGGPPIWTTEWV